MYKCVVCGKEFERGARIERELVYCAECSEELDLLVEEFEVAYMEARLYNKPLPNIDKHITKHRTAIERLKQKPERIKYRILRRCMDFERLRV